MAVKYFADIHIHSTLKPIHQIPQTNIWEEVFTSNYCEGDNLPQLLKGLVKSITTYSQSNLARCIAPDGSLRTRVLFLSLYPPEMNMFDLRDLLESLLSENEEINLGTCLSGFARANIEKYLTTRKDNQMVDYYEGTNGFDGLKQEYAYILQQTTSSYQGKKMAIATDYQSFKDMIDNYPDWVVSIITIEGLHALAKHNTYSNVLEIPFSAVNNAQSAIFRYYYQLYQTRILELKNWGNGKHSPLFITFTHHFWNLMCGHARSFEGLMRTFGVNQSFCLNEGFSLLGVEVMRMLLSKQNGRRILIDMKHMSTRARRDFYQLLNNEYLKEGDNVPIICSHAAVSGIRKLADRRNERDNRDKIGNYYFNNWSINLCDEDIINIYQTKGLIGLIMFPERLAGGIARNILDSNLNPEQRILEIVKLLMANLFHIIRVCNTREAWDLVCLGSDFDGLIGAFREYNELDDYDTLAQHFFQFLNLLPEDSYSGKTDVYPVFTRLEYKRLMFGYTPEQIVDKIMYKNVESFLERYFNEDYLVQKIS